MEISKLIPILSINISSETLRVNAVELHNYLECEIPFKQWIEDLINGYKGFHEYIIVKEPAIGSKSNPILVYYINIKLAKTAALMAKTSKGEIAYNYFKNNHSGGFLSIIKE